MINVSNEIKQAYDKSTTQVDKLVINGSEYRINKVEYYDDVYNEGNIFGTAIAKGLDFEIENAVNLEGQEIEYLTGIITDGVVQWISLGNFIIQSVESNDTTNINKVSAMDYMLKTNISYETSLDYTSGKVTLLQVLQEVCDNSGLTLATTNFVNSNFIVDSNQFDEGTLNRQVIQAVAQVSGTVAKIRNNKLYLLSPSTTVSKVFTLNNYKEAEIKRATHPINVVSLGLTDVEGENITLRYEESISKNGENVLAINDNPFAYTQGKREQLITALFEAVKGFEYKAYTFYCQGLPYLETMDKIQYKDKKGNTYDSYVFRFNYKSPNGLDSTIEAPSITSATVNYQNVPSALDIAKKTEYRVNKQEQKITELIKETTEQSEKIVLVEKSLEGVKTNVSSVEEKINTVEEEVENVKTNSIKEVQVLYSLGDSTTEAPTSDWSPVAPEWQSGKYMWQKTITTYTDNTSTESEATCITGATGVTGTDGKGIKSITKYYLASSIGGGSGSTIEWDGNTADKETMTIMDFLPFYRVSDQVLTKDELIGQTFTMYGEGENVEFEIKESTTDDEYIVSDLTDDGNVYMVSAYLPTIVVIKEPTADYPQSPGIYFMHLPDGSGYTSSLTVPAPSVTVDTEGWTTEIQTTDEINKYLWNYEVIEYTDGTNYISKPVIIGIYAADGIGVKEVISQYYLSTSNTDTVDGEWTETQPDITSGTYMWTRSQITWTDGTVTTTTPILATVTNTMIEKFAQQEITNESITSEVSRIDTTLKDDYITKEESSTQYQQLDKSFKFAIDSAITDLKNDGVPKVSSKIVTISDNGIEVGASDSEYTNRMDNTGNYQYYAGELRAKYDKDGADIPKLKSDIAIIAGLKSVREDVDGIIHHRTYVLE